MIRKKYAAGNEDFNTVLYRYSILMSALNFGITEDSKPKQPIDGGLIKTIRETRYSEITERLILLYSFGTISADMLRKLIEFSAPTLEDAIEAEKLLMESESEKLKRPKDDTYDGLAPDKINYELFEGALWVSANSRRHEPFMPVSFKKLYDGLMKSAEHIAVIDGVCYPDSELLKFLSEKEKTLVRYEHDSRVGKPAERVDTSYKYTLDELKTAYRDYDASPDELQRKYSELMNSVPAIRDVAHVLEFIPYFDKLYGQDFIRFCGKEEITSFSEKLYEGYITEQKLRFDFSGYVRRRRICEDRINHFDYDSNDISGGRLVDNSLLPDERYTRTVDLDITEVTRDEPDGELLRKALNKYKNTAILPHDLIVMVKKDSTALYFIYDAHKNSFSELDSDSFLENLFDFNKLWKFISAVSEKHLIRKISDTEVTVEIDRLNNTDYVKEHKLTDSDYYYAKNIIREQLERQEARRVRMSQGLKSLTQLKMSAEDAMKKADEEKQRKIAEKQAAQKQIQDSMNKRRKNGVE